MNDMPLSVVVETARVKIVSAVNEAIAETKLPACIVEGIVNEILADVRARKNFELVKAYTAKQKDGDE